MKLENLTLKGALAFFLVCVAAFMCILWMLHPPTGDASQIGLLAGFVTLFIKMAADAVGYQYSSSAGSDKKDETSAGVARALADKVASAPGAQPQLIVVWWSVLTDEEKQKITTAAPADPKVMAFVTAANIGKATPEDLHYLVAQGLLTQERATVIEKT
jgi:hypothetical protein